MRFFTIWSKQNKFIQRHVTIPYSPGNRSEIEAKEAKEKSQEKKLELPREKLAKFNKVKSRCFRSASRDLRFLTHVSLIVWPNYIFLYRKTALCCLNFRNWRSKGREKRRSSPKRFSDFFSMTFWQASGHLFGAMLNLPMLDRCNIILIHIPPRMAYRETYLRSKHLRHDTPKSIHNFLFPIEPFFFILY
jgi:hypothetical protein